MSFLSKNLAVLKNKIGIEPAEVAKIIEKVALQYELVPSRTGEYGLIYHGEEGDHTVHSKYDPLREATRIIDSETDNVADANIIVVLGFGLGYHIEVLIQRMHKYQQLFIVEPSDGPGLLALDKRDLTNILGNGQVHLLITDSSQNVGAAFRNIVDVQRDPKIAFLFFAPQEKIYRQFFKEANQAVVDTVHAKKMEENTLKAIGFTTILSSVYNIGPYLSNPGIKELFDKFTNVPAFIVAAGPSLNKNVDLLKKVKDKGIIIAAGTAVSTLQSHGIQPNLVVTLDPGDPNYKIFDQISLPNSVLVADLQTNHKILGKFTEPKFMFANLNSPIAKWFHHFYKDRDSFLLSGGSVANSACCLAYRMGCNPIVFVGQDLCLGEDGQTHSIGTVYEGRTESVVDAIQVEGNDGGKVWTMHNWYSFLQWFGDFIRDNPDREYINATEGGAYIKGTKKKSLNQVITQYCDQEIQVQKELLAILDNYQSDNQLKQKALDVLDEKIKEVAHIRKKIEKACLSLSTIKREAGKINRHLQVKLLEQIRVINEYLNNSQEFALVEQINYTIVSETMRKTHMGDRSGEDNLDLAAQDTLVYYTAMIESATFMGNILGWAKEILIGEGQHGAK